MPQSNKRTPDLSKASPVTQPKNPDNLSDDIGAILRETVRPHIKFLITKAKYRLKKRGETPADSEDYYVKEATQSIKALLSQQVIAELEAILSNSSGGGSWRRVIELRLAKLKQEEGSDE